MPDGLYTYTVLYLKGETTTTAAVQGGALDSGKDKGYDKNRSLLLRIAINHILSTRLFLFSAREQRIKNIV